MTRYKQDGHVTNVDRSPDTGSLVVCTCGAALGPLGDHGRALIIAQEHRERHHRRWC
ncbi:hypothetical protein [Microbacterium sp. SY138]|uniref:hypothetical protein n=1 Tax=Microbacterium sp. SY138 TaxID=3149040 RepID=UPI00321AC5B2